MHLGLFTFRSTPWAKIKNDCFFFNFDLLNFYFVSVSMYENVRQPFLSLITAFELLNLVLKLRDLNSFLRWLMPKVSVLGRFFVCGGECLFCEIFLLSFGMVPVFIVYDVRRVDRLR